jgi:hypothetical protein
VVVLPGGLPDHQRGELGLDLGLGQRVRDALVGADRLGPDLSLGGIPRRGAQGITRDPDTEGGSGDPFGIQAVENLPEPLSFLADQGTRMIGVMTSSRPTTKLSEAWAAWNASGGTDGSAPTSPTTTIETAVDAVASADATPPEPQINPVDPGPHPEPVAVAAGVTESMAEQAPAPAAISAPATSPDPAPQSGSSFSGMSWLRRDKGNDQKS